MLERIFKRRDVLEFVEEVISSNSYDNKKNSFYDTYETFYGSTSSLFIFFDALYKYQVIIEDDFYLNDYIMQVRKLLRKLDSVSDINDGINKIIGKTCALKLGLINREDSLAKEYIIKYVYDKYIVNGYVFHGFPSIYREQIIKNGMIPEQYHNTYDKFIEVDKILSRGRDSVINKNFNDASVSFTDSFVMGCFYAYAAPMYFYRLLGDSKIDYKNYSELAYFKNGYFGCFNNLNALMKSLKIGEGYKKNIIRTCYEEWRTLKTDVNVVSIMAVKRSVFGINSLDEYEDIINNSSSCDLGRSLGRIFNTINNDIKIRSKINASDIRVINISNYKTIMNNKKKQLEEIKNRQSNYNSDKIVNAYGSASVLMLIGSVLITLGVIITIIMINRG